MDRLISMSMLMLKSRLLNGRSGYFELQIREHAMTASMHASLTAIGRQLYADYLPVLAKPLPSELKGLVVRLFALEIGSRAVHRGFAIHYREAGTAVVVNQVSIARQTDQVG
jgi:hypothetical protein